jgi:hypothetical protein
MTLLGIALVWRLGGIMNWRWLVRRIEAVLMLASCLIGVVTGVKTDIPRRSMLQ